MKREEERNKIINRCHTDLEKIINGHDPEVGNLNNDIWDRLDRMAVEIEALTQAPAVAVSDEMVASSVKWFDKNFNGMPDSKSLVHGILEAALTTQPTNATGETADFAGLERETTSECFGSDVSSRTLSAHNSSIDNRPSNCRFRLKDEGKGYPKSGCQACGKNIMTGLGKECHYEIKEGHTIVCPSCDGTGVNLYDGFHDTDCPLCWGEGMVSVAPEEELEKQDETLEKFDSSAIMWSLEGIEPKPSDNGQWVKHSDALDLIEENKRLRETLEWFMIRRNTIQAKFNLHGPDDTAKAMKIAFDNAEKALEG